MQLNTINRFIIRVYGIIINDKDEVLLSDEYQLGMKMTKFPGGGLEFGEGPEDCIKREAMEEFGQEIEIIEHFYTTGFFQKALFHDDAQLVSIYYRIKFKTDIQFKISVKPFDFPEMKDGNQSFRWKPIKDIIADDVTFPIDKKVVEMLIS
jgi:ADP-ribose pyrophosphatase YjhB (NUDIX family)